MSDILGTLALFAICSVLIIFTWILVKLHRKTTPAASASYSAPGLGLLALSGEASLIVGAIVDLFFGLVIISLLNNALQLHLLLVTKILAGAVVGGVKYAWSINLGNNRVPLFERGVLTRVGKIVESGPDGNGLLPGYYWFLLGWPFYTLAKQDSEHLVTTSAKEFTIKFEQMKVWAVNVPPGGRGAVEGMIDGIANFEMINVAEFNAAKEALLTLDSYVRESARDKVEHLTMEEFIARKNEELAADILASINKKLLESNGGKPHRFGVRLKSVNVTQTDNKSKVLEDAWAEVPAQVALAASRATDAAGRVRRIRAYDKAGVEPNRAVAADLVADDKAGAKIGDERFNVDVGPGLGNVVKDLIAKIPGQGARS